jgi:hypothetical protein
MKTRIILPCLAFLLFPEIGMPNSDEPSLKSSNLKHDDIMINLSSEIETKDTTDLDLKSDQLSKNIEPTNKFDITAFIKPEEEVDDLDFDTKIIFKKLMKEKLESK